MGYMFVIGDCYLCHQPFSFSATQVPSVRDSLGIRQPVCKDCIALVNAKRREIGLAPFPILPGAYEADEA